MATQAFTSPISSQQERGRGGKRLEDNTLLPMTAHQLLNLVQQDHPDDAFRINGCDITYVTLVGLILETKAESTHHSYKVDDGTGCIDVRQWIQHGEVNDQEEARRGKLKEGIYVRVSGNLNQYMDQKSIMAWQITPIEDFNELTYHLLSVINTHLLQTKGPLPSATTAPGAAATATSTSSTAPGNQAYGAPAGDDSKNLTPCQQAVYNHIQTVADEDAGLNIEILVERLPQFPSQDVKEAVEFLFQAGYLCSTEDEDHYRTL
eukprot:gnl/Trimastix_PCT/1416.p1 GENE.gnl/Trimastix_PCT/1416~~gnl/Trimastix_PCT/1416.p1  ORF type:complete len:263 (-),score=50.67 gnl/Trimastix_PCT/1416:51-839(-)